jgi:hypothetical protein
MQREPPLERTPAAIRDRPLDLVPLEIG